MATRILSTLALKGVLEKCRAPLERAAGPLEIEYGATQAIVPRVRAGERADLLILTAEAIGELRSGGLVGEAWTLGCSGVGVAVRAGARKPDIGSTEALTAALLAAASVAHSKVGASGIYFAGILERLGIAGRLQKRVVVESGPVGLAVARGEAEIGVQQICELIPVAGIDIVGPLPPGLQKLTCFAAGIAASAPSPQGAAALAAWLRTAEARAAMDAGGIELKQG
jgi:molybdate transport system substrate-binding protein